MKVYLHFFMWSIVIVFSANTLFAQTATPQKNPGTVQNGSGGGDDYPWVTPQNAALSDDNYAWYDVSGAYTGFSYPLKATNFGFAVPAGSTITGIVVSIERHADTQAHDVAVQLLINGTAAGDNKADIYEDYPDEDEEIYYGGDDDLWGNALTPDIVNSGNFGVVLATKVPDLGPVYVDAFTMIVYYIAPPAPDPHVGVAIAFDGSAPVSSAILELKSNSQGFLLPRMNTTQRNAITSPAAGLMVYDNTLTKPCYYNGSSWQTFNNVVAVAPSGGGSGVSGNENDLISIISDQNKKIEKLIIQNQELTKRLELLEKQVNRK